MSGCGRAPTNDDERTVKMARFHALTLSLSLSLSPTHSLKNLLCLNDSPPSLTTLATCRRRRPARVLRSSAHTGALFACPSLLCRCFVVALSLLCRCFVVALSLLCVVASPAIRCHPAGASQSHSVAVSQCRGVAAFLCSVLA